MKSVLLIGLGRFGRHIAEKLYELNHQVMAVDHCEKRVNAALPYVTSAQIGDSTDPEFLSSSGVRNFDLCIVAIGEDFQSSLETVSLLKGLGAGFVVARAARDVHAKFLLRNGADEIIYPEKQLAVWNAIRYSSDSILDYIELDEDYAVFELALPRQWCGKTIGELDIRRRYNINIIAVRKTGRLSLNIRSETLLIEHSTLLVLGSSRDIQKCFHIRFYKTTPVEGEREDARYFLLLPLVLIWGLGCFLLKKLDRFMEKNQKPVSQAPIADIPVEPVCIVLQHAQLNLQHQRSQNIHMENSSLS